MTQPKHTPESRCGWCLAPDPDKRTNLCRECEDKARRDGDDLEAEPPVWSEYREDWR